MLQHENMRISLGVFPLVDINATVQEKRHQIKSKTLHMIKSFPQMLSWTEFSLGLSRALTSWSEATSVWFWLYVLVYCCVERRIILQLPALSTVSQFFSVPIILSFFFKSFPVCAAEKYQQKARCFAVGMV